MSPFDIFALCVMVVVISIILSRSKKPKTNAEKWMDIANGRDEATLEYREALRSEAIKRSNEGRPKFNGTDKAVLIAFIFQIGVVIWLIFS